MMPQVTRLGLRGAEVKPDFLTDPFLGLSPRQASREMTLDSCRGLAEPLGVERPWASGERQSLKAYVGPR